MPFKSQQQRKYMWSTMPDVADDWEKHTPKNKKLPKKVGEEIDLVEFFIGEARPYGLSAPLSNVARYDLSFPVGSFVKLRNGDGPIVDGIVGKVIKTYYDNELEEYLPEVQFVGWNFDNEGQIVDPLTLVKATKDEYDRAEKLLQSKAFESVFIMREENYDMNYAEGSYVKRPDGLVGQVIDSEWNHEFGGWLMMVEFPQLDSPIGAMMVTQDVLEPATKEEYDEAKTGSFSESVEGRITEMPHIDVNAVVAGRKFGTVDLRIEKYPISHSEKDKLMKKIRNDGVVGKMGTSYVKFGPDDAVEEIQDNEAEDYTILPEYWEDFFLNTAEMDPTDDG